MGGFAPGYVSGVQRRALGVLFSCLAAALLVIAVAALVTDGGHASGLIVGFAALALAGWLGSLALSAFRRN